MIVRWLANGPRVWPAIVPSQDRSPLVSLCPGVCTDLGDRSEAQHLFDRIIRDFGVISFNKKTQ